jgi:Mn-dependent DtxR family transcriptional regulator
VNKARNVAAKWADEDLVMAARLKGGHSMSIADLARELDWFLADGRPYKSRVQRALRRLKADKLMEVSRGKWDLLPKGEKAAHELKNGE